MEEGMDGKGMDDVISVSSGSEEYDSDVEIVDYTERNANLKRFGIRGDAVAGRFFIDLNDPRWRFPKRLKRLRRQKSDSQTEVVELIDITDGTEQTTLSPETETENNNHPKEKKRKKEDKEENKEDTGGDSLIHSSRDLNTLKPFVKLRRLPLAEADPKTSTVHLGHSITTNPHLSVPKSADLDEGSATGTTTYTDNLGVDGQDGTDGEEANGENKFDGNFRDASREDGPIALMSGSTRSLSAEEKCGVGFRPPKVLCRQSLYLVYITSESGHWEETLETLSDLLQPGFYAPRDITCHLLQDILLNVRCPQHLCVKAFKLLMKTQRHHNADEDTVPWDWELLSSVMDNEDHTKRHRCQTVRIFLEYVMQTLEDDFQTKVSHSALHHSIAKANLSCDLQFPKVRDVTVWLFAAIRKSSENVNSREAARERGEHIRMVSVFQRMLSLALRVDHSPAVSASKLSLELCHMLMSRVTSRAHRLLLLESLQSELLRYKLLEYLLDYACSKRIHRPMSISLVLHFLKDCTLTPDSMDGTERWQRWEELVNLLWMLLLSYKQVKDSVRALVHQPYDTVSRPAVREAVESFLSRSQADLGQALPLHVAESLTYLQDCLLNACQC